MEYGYRLDLVKEARKRGWKKVVDSKYRDEYRKGDMRFVLFWEGSLLEYCVINKGGRWVESPVIDGRVRCSQWIGSTLIGELEHVRRRNSITEEQVEALLAKAG